MFTVLKSLASPALVGLVVGVVWAAVEEVMTQRSGSRAEDHDGPEIDLEAQNVRDH
jgi:hypothetical protein